MKAKPLHASGDEPSPPLPRGGDSLSPQATLPPDWQRVKLGELCNLVNGDAYRDTDWSTKGVPIIRIQNLNNHEKPFNYWAGNLADRVIVTDGDVLLAWSGTPGTSFGTHRWDRGRAVLNQHIFRVDLDLSRLDPDWAVFAINEQLEEMIGRAHGAVGLRHLARKEVESLEILLPPLPEQRRIAARLHDQLAAVAEARAAVQAQTDVAQVLPAVQLRAAFTNTAASRWPKCRLGDLLRLRKEVVHPRDNPSGPAVFVGLEHVQSLTGERNGSLPVEMSQLTGRKPRFYTGDIVYGYLRPYLNKLWVAEFDGLCSVDQYVYEVNREKADTDFVAWFMRSPVYLERAPIDTSPGQLPRIRTEEVASVEINLLPLNQQRALVAKMQDEFTETTALKQTLSARLAALDHLPAALLREAFAGRL